MNQDQIKEKLLILRPDVEEFSVIFSGKESRKVNGLYRPETKEIIIHNRNFEDDNSMIYTAIHELAHHIHFTSTPGTISCRAHTIEFRNIFHRLLQQAEEKGVYLPVFEAVDEFKELTREIREKFLSGGGNLMKDFGRILIAAKELCDRHQARFEDYVERVLCIPQNSAVTFMKLHAMNINPAVGFENMKTLAAIRNPEQRSTVEAALLQGETPDMVKAALKQKKEPPSEAEALLKEREKIRKTIETLQEKLDTLEEKLRDLEPV